jgi:hypothetical protein
MALLALPGSSGVLEVTQAASVERLVCGAGSGILVEADETLLEGLRVLAGIDVHEGEDGEYRLVWVPEDERRQRRVGFWGDFDPWARQSADDLVDDVARDLEPEAHRGPAGRYAFNDDEGV